MVALLKTSLLSTARILAYGAPLALAACSSDFGPYPMPSGYAHHGELHKAPPGPEPVFEAIDRIQPDAPDPGTMEDTAMDGQIQAAEAMAALPAIPADWTAAAHDLVNRLIAGFGRPTEAIYVEPATGGGGYGTGIRLEGGPARFRSPDF